MNWHNQKGSSLVEIMVALVIFGIGVTAAMRMLPQSSAHTTHSRNRSIAVNMAQEKIEELMSDGFKDADLTAGNHDDPGNPINIHYTRSWSITDDTPVTGMKAISVTVTFPAAGADSSTTLRTYKSSRQ
jgi:prepilin-type N-terminal cleavage/methylation domain-containing protein